MLFAIQVAAVFRLAGGFCTAHSPLDGSVFSFPQRRCLTQEFMEAQFQSGVFGAEPINLSTEVRNIVYNGAAMPLALEASLGWESGHTVSAVADIILREILGINTTMVCTWGSVHAMKMLGGCSNPMDPTTSCMKNGVPVLSNPLAHVSVESWVTTPAEVDEMNTYNTNLGMIGYFSKSGLYMDKKIAEDAYTSKKITLEWWKNLVEIPDISDHFDTYTAIAEDVNATFGGGVAPRCVAGDSGFAELQREGLTCSDGWYFGPACAADKSSCVPVILAEYDWNGLVWIKAVEQHGYRFAVTWLGSQNWLLYSMRTSKKLMFYCATTSSLCYEKPIVKMFADTKMPVGRPDLITSLLKVIWNQLPGIEPRIVEFLSQMNLPSDDLQALMTSYSQKQALPGANIDDFVPQIACDWLTNKLSVLNSAGSSTGANSAKWARWIPRVCQPGHTYDKAMGQCRACPPGEYSLDGRLCIPCSPGTYAATVASAACSACEEGTWQASTGGTACSDCPAGTQRSTRDKGCQQCGPGHYTSVERQPWCDRCPRGSWIATSGATECNMCGAGSTTHKEASTSDIECGVDPAVVVIACVLATLPMIGCLLCFMGWRLARYRQSKKEAWENMQMYFKGAVAVMRTMCSSGVTLRISPDGYILSADPPDGLEGLKEGVQIQDCIPDKDERGRFDRHLKETMQKLRHGETFASPFNFAIKALFGDKPLLLKSYAIALKANRRWKLDPIVSKPVPTFSD